MAKPYSNEIYAFQQTNPAPPSGRLASADLLKVVAIFSVVFIHGSAVIPVTHSSSHINRSDIVTATTGLRFCVPVFIFLWAYFMEKSILKRGNDHIKPRLYKLLVPFGFWSMVYFIITADIAHLTIGTVISKHWSGYGWSGQYYFIILFQLLLLFPYLRKIIPAASKVVPWIYLAGLTFYICVSYSGWFGISTVAKLSDRLFFYWLPYVILGVIYAHKSIFKFSLPLWIGIFSVALVPAELYFLEPQQISLYVLPSVFVCSMVLISSMERGLSYSQLPFWLGTVIEYLANYTLGIFCLNPLIILGLHVIFGKVDLAVGFPGAPIMTSLLSTGLIICLCVLIISLLKKVKLGFLVSN